MKTKECTSGVFCLYCVLRIISEFIIKHNIINTQQRSFVARPNHDQLTFPLLLYIMLITTDSLSTSP